MTVEGTQDETRAIRERVREFVASELLYGEDEGALDATTPLISSKVLDSISVVKLVEVLEREFEIRLKPHEMDEDHLNTLDQIAELVQRRRAGD